MQAGTSTSKSEARAGRTNGSLAICGSASITISGWSSRTSRAGPHAGSSNRHKSKTSDDDPTKDEHLRGCTRNRSAIAARDA